MIFFDTHAKWVRQWIKDRRMEKLYPLMFGVVAAAITAGVVLFGGNDGDAVAVAPSLGWDEAAAQESIAPLAQDTEEQVSAPPAVEAPAEPAPPQTKTVQEPLCAIENGRKRCRFIAKEVPIDS